MWCVWLERSGRSRLHVGSPGRQAVPLPGGQWVRVRNLLAGLGEADLALAEGDAQGTSAQAIPQPQRRYLGREVVGQVVEVGADATLVRVGDRVALVGETLSTCATLNLQPPCKPCATGNPALCEHRAVPWGGTGAGWADEMVVHESQLFLVPEVLTNDQAVLLEPAARAVRAVLRRLPEPGMQTLVIGTNLVGLLIAATIKAMVPSAQIALATDVASQIDAARQLGVGAVLPASAGQLSQRGALLTNAQTFERQGTTYVLGGFDHIYDCLGTHASLGEAVRLARSGGLVVIVAAPARAVHLDPSLIQQDEVSIVGIAGAGIEPAPPDAKSNQSGRWSSQAVAARLLRKGQVKVDTFITQRRPYREFRQAVRLARAGATRVVITFD